MRVYLDRQPLPDDTVGDDSTIMQAVEAARSRLVDGGLIVSLKCNGQVIGEDKIQAILTQHVGEFERVDLESGEPRQIVIDALTDVRKSFQDTYAAVKAAAETLAAGKLDESMTTINQCAAVWVKANTSIVQAISLLQLKVDDIIIDERPLPAWLGDVTERLRELKEAIESRDHVLLGDILRYEFDETLEQWERVLDGFIAHVKSLDPSAVKA